jgi:hypothetical protein
MIRHACPNCDHEFHTPDELAGLPIQCWNCHKSVEVPRPAPVAAATATATAVAPRVTADDAEMDAEVGFLWTVRDFGQRLMRGEVFRRFDPEPAHRGHCMLCGEPGIEVRRFYLRVVGLTHLVTFAFARQVNVQGWGCDGCYRKGVWLKRARLLCLLAMGGLLLVWLFMCIPLASEIPRTSEMSMEAAKAVSLGILIAPLAVLLVLPFLLQPWLKRRTRGILSRDVDARLRELAGVRRWGFFTSVLFSHRRRAGEQCVNL